MLNDLLLVAGQVSTLFLLMAAGFLLVKLGKLNKEGLDQTSTLLLYVVTPCVILDAFRGEDLGGGMALAATLGVLAAYYILAVPLSALFFRAQAPDDRAVLRFGVTYGNVGFMGLPLLQGVLGEGAMLYGAISVALMNTFYWTHGVVVMGGRVSLKKVLLNPGVTPLLAALALNLAGLEFPAPVSSAVGFMAALNTPLAMVVIGGQMASADLASTFAQPKLYGAAAVKLLLFPALTALVLLPFRPEPMLYCAAVIVAATPTAGVTSILAQRFGRSPASAAQLVTLSTLLSILTLPLFSVLAQTLARGF